MGVANIGNGLIASTGGGGGPTRLGGAGNNDTKAGAAQAWMQRGNSANVVVNPNAPDPGSTAFWNKVAPGIPMSVITQYLQQHPGPETDKLITQGLQYSEAIDNPDPWYDKVLQELSLMTTVGMITAGVGGIAAAPAAGAAGAGTGAAAGSAVGGLGLGSIGAGALGGAAGGAASSLLTSGGKHNFLGSTAMGALGGAAGGAAAPLTGDLTSAGVNPMLAGALVKGGIGAATGALGGAVSGTGAGRGALIGGASGVASSLVSAGAKDLGAGNGLANGIGKEVGSLAGGAVGNFLGGPTPPHMATGGMGAGALAAGALGAGALYDGQGNIGNMALNPQTYGSGGSSTSTDSTLAGTFTGALPGIVQAGAGIYGSQNAAEKMTQADQNAIGTQQSTLGNIGNIWQPQRNLGIGADTALGTALGTNGKPADYSGFENMPGYKFAVDQGTRAIQRQAAAMGNAYTPNTAAAVGQYVTGTAMQDYNTYINQLMGAAGLGSTANAGLATPTYQTGANISQLQQNQGYAQASGVSGAANAVGGAFAPGGAGSSLIGAAGRYLFGGGGSNNVGSGGFNPRLPVSAGNLFNYGGDNPNGTGVGGSPSDPYGANTALYNANNPYTGYDGGVDNSINTGFDPNSVEAPTFDNSNFDFGGSLDYGSNTDSLNFLGGP